jgi:hypothetical protein
MGRLVRIGKALVLTLVLSGLLVADGLVLGGGQVRDETQQAELLPWWFLKNIKVATAHYDANGNLTGCYGPPRDCLIIVASTAKIGLATGGVALLD